MNKNTTNAENKNRDGYLVKTISICGFSIVFAICAFFAANIWNPDSDSYWLIETGRWIWENKSVPKINPWIQVDNFSVIIQQPICALLNYLTYSISGSLKYMWILAVTENAVMLICFALLGKKIFDKFCPVKERTPKQNRIITAKIFMVLTIIEVLCGLCNMITTRPYQITMTATVLLLCALETHTQYEHYGKLALKVGLLTLWQANFQMASLIFIPFILFLYMTGNAIEKLKNHILLKQEKVFKWMGVYAAWGIASLLNPYGLNGSLYLFKSGNAVSMLKNFINEMASPSMVSIFGILIVAVFLMMLRLIKEKVITMSHIFLCVGASVLNGCAVRNCWMVIVSLSLLLFIHKATHWDKIKNPTTEKLKQFYKAMICDLPSKFAFLIVEKKEINEDKKSLRFFEKTICVLSFGLSLLIIVSSPYAPNERYEEDQQYIDIISELPKNVKIYTDFNTGGIVEFCQRKCNIDARPELYSPEITKSEINLINEYKNFDIEGADDFEEQIKTMDYDYYFVRKNSLFQYFLRFGHHAEIIHESDNSTLYGSIQG